MSIIWPFRNKVGTAEGGIGDPTTQWRRIDQGQDLQGLGPGEEDVLALAAGTVTYAHDPADPHQPGAHFGDPYPILHFNSPVDGNPACYYGHTFPATSENVHVNQGDVIAHTGSPGGGLAPNHWLELGWWNYGPTNDGQSMHDHLVGAPVWNPAPPPPLKPPVITQIVGDKDVASRVDFQVHTDANGDGYTDLPGVDAAKIISVIPNGQNPVTGGYHKVFQATPLNVNGAARIPLVTDAPNAVVDAHAWVSA